MDSRSSFNPDGGIYRWEAVQMLWQMAGSPFPNPFSPNPFKDVNEKAAYYNALLWAYQKGIVQEDYFRPNSICTRAEAVTLLYKADQVCHFRK